MSLGSVRLKAEATRSSLLRPLPVSGCCSCCCSCFVSWLPPSGGRTQPVTIRFPSGTSTRIPGDGIGIPSGTLYVSESRVGTGTATVIGRIASRAALVVVPLQEDADLLHVLPHVALALRAAQQKGRMERRDQLGAAVVVDAAAQPRDRILSAQQR